MPLARAGYPANNTDFLFFGGTAAAADYSKAPRFNMPRSDIASDTAALTTQVLTTVALPLSAGDLVTKIAFKSGATAAGTPTNYWFALYDTAGNLISQTADQTTTAWAADTTKDLALATPYLVGTPGVYYAGIMVKATTVPSLIVQQVPVVADYHWFTNSPNSFAWTSGSSLAGGAPTTLNAVLASQQYAPIVFLT